MPYSAEADQAISVQASKDGYFGQAKGSYSEAIDWSVDDLFGFTDFNQNYGFQEQGSSKADSGKLGGSDGSPPCFAADMGVDFDECFGQVPEMSYDAVPQVPSPPTASGLHWQKSFHYPAAEHAVFVPDITSRNFDGYQRNPKRRKPC